MKSSTILFIVITSVCSGQAWTQLPDLPGIARDDGAAFSIGDNVYVGTGMDVGYQLTSDWYAFNTLSESWSTIAALPASGRQYCAAFSIGGTGYLFGGVDGGALNELWAYDAATDQWQQKASLPSAGRSGSVAFVMDGKGYIATGKVAPSFEPSTELWIYDPTNDNWAQGPSLPPPGRALASAFVIGDTAFVQGGQLSDGSVSSDFFKYSIATNSWSIAAGAGIHLFGSDAFGTGNQGMIICGIPSLELPYEIQTEVYNSTNGLWSWNPPTFIGPGRKGGCGALVNDVVYYGTGIAGLERKKDWYKFSWPVGMNEVEQDSLSIIGPDLLFGPAVFTIVGSHGPVNAEVIDGLGRVQLHVRVNGNVLSLPQLHAGQYILRYADNDRYGSFRFQIVQ